MPFVSIDDYRSIVYVFLNKEDGALPVPVPTRFIIVEFDLLELAILLSDCLPVIALVILLSISSRLSFLAPNYAF